MKNTLNQNTMNNTEIKKNYATAIKGEAIIGARINLSAADVVAMEETIYNPLIAKLEADKVVRNSHLDVWRAPEGMTDEEFKKARDKYAKENGYEDWRELKCISNWSFNDIEKELETFFLKIRVQGVQHLESTLFTPIVNEENE